MEVRPELANSSCSRLPKQKSSAHLPNLSREARLWTTVVDELPGGHSKGGGFSSCPRRVQWHCPRAPTPEPDKGRRPKNRQSQRRNVFLPGCSVFSLSWPACAGAFLVPCPWFSGPAPSGSFYVSFHWPRASRSSSQREGRRVKLRMGTDPRTGTGHRPKDRLFSGITLYAVRLHFLSYVRGSIARVWSRVLGHIHHGRRFHSQVRR